MNNVEVFVFGICFAATAGCAFAFMWQSMSMLREEQKPRKRNIHPEMQNVQSGEELLEKVTILQRKLKYYKTIVEEEEE